MTSKKITGRSIAYLMGSASENGRPIVKLLPKDNPVVRLFLEELHICYLAGNEESYEYIQNRHLEEDGVSPDELHQIGLRNLKRLTIERNFRVQPYGNVFAFMMNGDFEASVMLLDEFWDGEFQKFVAGQYAVAVPARDVLVFCDAQSPAGIVELQQIIDRIWPAGDHLVSNKIYLRQHHTWQVRRS
ncbi:MAG TPA: DUF1444 family protein [Candidatus Acidoferrales bacterium]|nr:DUF1444 family protein [Candidatus Acidoferrales bacterium]